MGGPNGYPPDERSVAMDETMLILHGSARYMPAFRKIRDRLHWIDPAPGILVLEQQGRALPGSGETRGAADAFSIDLLIAARTKGPVDSGTGPEGGEPATEDNPSRKGGRLMIQSYSFGRMKIKNRLYTSDLKIVNGRIVDNWYREGGHQVGVEDVGDILSTKPEVVVFGTGDQGRMHLNHVLKNTLNRRNIDFIEKPTADALDAFNQMVAKGKKVAGAFHLTC